MKSHDPGADASLARGDAAGASSQKPIKVGRGEVRVGTASWTDPTMTVPGVFYPKGVSTAEERLRYYASQFPLVEVDSTYYALPNPFTAKMWVTRTPKDFVFDVKAHALMTGQPTEVARLPKAIREDLPKELAEKKRIYRKDLPKDCSTPCTSSSATRSSRWSKPASSARSSCSFPSGSFLRTRLVS